jgi:hypothetical protein
MEVAGPVVCNEQLFVAVSFEQGVSIQHQLQPAVWRDGLLPPMRREQSTYAMGQQTAVGRALLASQQRERNNTR